MLDEKILKFYLSKVGREELEKIAIEAISVVRNVGANYRKSSEKITEILGEYEIDYVLNEVKGLFKEGKLKKISTSWLQRRYKIGYARAARYIDILAEKKVIRATERPTVWVEY